MANTIEGYLTELRAALAGSDPALVQDALYDADEYLRSAVADAGDDPTAVLAAIEAYGTPAEVALAYREREAHVTAAMRRPAPKKGSNPFAKFFGVVADPGAWGAMFYMLLAFVTGILYFTIVTTGLSLTLGFAVLIVGIPFALLFIAVVRAVSLAEGRIVEGMLGVRMPRRPRVVAPPSDSGFWASVWNRIKMWFTDYRTWTTMLYMLIQLGLGIIYFTILVTALSICATLIALPIVQMFFPEPLVQLDGYGYVIPWWGAPFWIAGGLLGLLLTLWLAKGIGFVHGRYAKLMLVGRFEGAETEPVADGAAVATNGTQTGVS